MANNQKSWAHDRSSTVGASEVWDCLRKVWYEKRHVEFNIQPDEKDEDWGAMERGNLIENHFIVPGLRLALPKIKTLPEGITFLMAGDDQKTIVLGKNSATPDGLIKGLTPGPLTIRGGSQEIHIPDIKSDCICLEIKSIDPRATLLEEKAKHRGQTQVQLGLIREMTEYKPYFSIVLYVDASFLSNLTPFVVEFDENQYAVAKERAMAVYDITDPLMIVPEGRFVGACETCRWRGPCGTSQISAIPTKTKQASGDPVALAATDPLVQDYLAAKRAYENAEIALEVAKERVKESMMDHKVSSLAGPNWKATWYSVKGAKRLDQKKLAEDIDLTPYMKEGFPNDQLRITERLEETSTKPKKTKAKTA